VSKIINIQGSINLLISELHLVGAFGIPEILSFNGTRKVPKLAYAQWFPFWRICPNLVVRDAAQVEPNKSALLLVINLDPKTWNWVEPRMANYGSTALVQLEAYEGWELAYEKAARFKAFVNFDPTRVTHPNFTRINIPYDPKVASSHRDKRGFRTWFDIWVDSKHRFMDLAIRQLLPRRKKAVLIGALADPERYQVRLRLARQWAPRVDVFGRGWPTGLPNYRGVCINKLVVLKTYRYALVIENQRQAGYITEKLLDSFAAGTVPLYHGAPDALVYIPESMFYPIDEENSKIDEWVLDDARYQSAARSILQNRAAVFEEFSIAQFISKLKKALKTVL
jgi:hypothetical protein